MTYLSKSILWIIVGPVVSIIFGFSAFMIFVFALGNGIDIDDVGTSTEKFFERLALPLLGIIAIGGSVLSFVMGVRYAIFHQAIIADGFPILSPQFKSRSKKDGEQGGDGDAEESV